MRKLFPVLINTGLILGLILMLASVPASAETIPPPSEEGAVPARISGGAVYTMPSLQPAADSLHPSSEGGLVPLQAGAPLPNASRDLAPDDNLPLADPALAPIYSYYTVSGATLRPRDALSALAYYGNGCSYAPSTATNQIFNTSLQLPDGAIVKYLRVYLYDASPDGQIRNYLTYYQPGQSITDYIYLESGQSATPGLIYMVSPEVTLKIDNSINAYALTTWLTASGTDVRFCGMRVAYLPPQP